MYACKWKNKYCRRTRLMPFCGKKLLWIMHRSLKHFCAWMWKVAWQPGLRYHDSCLFRLRGGLLLFFLFFLFFLFSRKERQYTNLENDVLFSNDTGILVCLCHYWTHHSHLFTRLKIFHHISSQYTNWYDHFWKILLISLDIYDNIPHNLFEVVRLFVFFFVEGAASHW